ncbi:MAG: HEAT repeat domain-containing protein [Actinomycetota bacterium]
MENDQTLEALAYEVAAHPNEALYGRAPAVERLAVMGAPAVAAVLAQMRQPCPAGQHSRDVFEALGYVLNRIAKVDPQPVLDVIARDDVPPDPVLMFLVFALAGARRAQVLPTLRVALKHRNDSVRYAAITVLAQFGTKDSIAPLTEALRDRSHLNKFVAVEALTRKKRLRTPAAIEPLRRIVANSLVRKHSPGLWDNAQTLLSELEATTEAVK